MADVKVTVRLDIKYLMNDMMDSTTRAKIGEAIIDEAKQLIATGQSPVDGVGRFEPYLANQRLRKAKQKTKKRRQIAKLVKPIQALKAHTRSAVAKAKAGEAEARKGYPFGIPGKLVSPVNLTLTGEMLGSLKYEVHGDNGLRVGLIGAPGKVLVRAIAHNEGPTNDAFPQRNWWPMDGQSFTRSIISVIKRLYAERVSAIIERSNSSST